ncbi:guanine nucleotide-binding protein alpha-2 subunit, partial [Trifolium medium]|nr:guanine nucleotide-binding protein alpha-2 subunit [Trifolium medium]
PIPSSIVDGKRPTTVTFNEPRDFDSDGGDSYLSPRSVATEPVGSPVSTAVRQGKRGVCSSYGFNA